MDMHDLWVGASWEGFALNQFLRIIRPSRHFFWSTYSGAELDLLFLHRGRRWGMEFKFNEAPKVTRSMRIALEDLTLEHLWIIYPGVHRYLIDEKLSAWPLGQLPNLAAELQF
jgi:predicted AAA+ superfamily ATPase